MLRIVLLGALALVGCKRTSNADEVLAKLEGCSKAMCDCKDKACVDKVNDELTKWTAEAAKSVSKDDRPHPGDAKKAGEHMAKLVGCQEEIVKPKKAEK